LANITTIFFDVGGVLLTDGWNHISRKHAAEHFNLDFEELEHKHEPLAGALDSGQISINEYIDQTVFFKNRSFSKSDFFQFMKDQSLPMNDSLALAAALAAQNKYFMGTINNESIELGQFRIEKFKLANSFKIFCTSGFMGTKKPEALIFERALKITQKKATETVFIDDRQENLVAPKKLQMHTIHFENVPQVKAELAALGIMV
jgi:putative hydrolase of the HAD superfamily